MISCFDLEKGTTVEVPYEALVPRLAVYGIIIRGGNILLASTRYGYSLPGGKIELGETLEEALAREIYEETGLVAHGIEKVGAGEDFYIYPNDRVAYHSMFTVCSCNEISGEVSINQFNDDEAKYSMKAEWVSLDDKEKITSIYPRGILSLLKTS